MDGTIVDTEPYWIEAEHKLIEAHGGTWSHEQAVQLVGQSLDYSAGILQRAGVRLEVIQTLRFRGTPARAKQQIDAGKIGAVRMIQGRSLVRDYAIATGAWPGQPEHGGAFLDMGVQNFDIMRFWSGSEARRWRSRGSWRSPPGYPWLSAMVQIVFANGVVAQQWTSHETPAQSLTDSQHRYVVVGSAGALEVDGYGKLLLSTPDATELIWEQPTFDFVQRPLDPVRLEAFYTQTQCFVDDLLDGRPPTVPGAEGRAAVAIVEA